MKTIVIDMDELSDSIELYESRPNPALAYTIYTVLLVIVAAIVWSCFFKIETVVKSNGIIKSESPVYDVTSMVSGKIAELYVSDGDQVKKGDVLCRLSDESSKNIIDYYENEIKKIDDRIEILDAYAQSIENNDVIDTCFSDNQYYQEFASRRKLLAENIDSNEDSSNSKKEVYSDNLKTISSEIDRYKNKISKLQKAVSCVEKRSNTFESSDSYFYGIVDSYMSNYDYTAIQYDNSIAEYKSQLKTVKDDSQKQGLKDKIKTVCSEKKKALNNIETAQIAELEKSIENYTESIATLKNNLKSAKNEKSNVESSSASKSVFMLNETEQVAQERLTYVNKRAECENYLKSYTYQSKAATITAEADGTFSSQMAFKDGGFVQEGSTIGSIYTDDNNGFYAEIYVKNSDIGQVSEGQKVNIDISAYPSSKYGYFEGEITDISKDVVADKTTGGTYYVAKVKCDKGSTFDFGSSISGFKNGMSCKGKIVTGEKTVMDYLLDKINLVD